MTRQSVITARTNEAGFQTWKRFQQYCANNGMKIGAATVRALTRYMEDAHMSVIELIKTHKKFRHGPDEFEVEYLPHLDSWVVGVRDLGLNLGQNDYWIPLELDQMDKPGYRSALHAKLLQLEAKQLGTFDWNVRRLKRLKIDRLVERDRLDTLRGFQG